MCKWTVLTVITQKLRVQLHNSTANLLYKYCTTCTVCNWTVLTEITQKLLLHVQLHNSTAHLLYKYCTMYTVCNWTVLTVITQKLLLYVQLDNRRETAKLIIFWYEVQPAVWMYIITYIQRSFPSNSRYSLQVQCRNLTVIRYKWKFKTWLTNCANWKASGSTISVKCWFVWKFSESYQIIQQPTDSACSTSR